MSDSAGRVQAFDWTRAWPSGHVHAATSNGHGTVVTRCGISREVLRWTADFPPGCKTCPACEREVGPRLTTPARVDP